MATSDNTPALLALPVELVGRIADSLEPESLLMLRLTCKVLEHTTYDLFAKTFFERRFCCIYYEPRWLLMDHVISSRLGTRVREVTFTIEPLESKRYKDLQLAPDEYEADMKTAQRDAEGEMWSALWLQTHVQTRPSAAIIYRVFRAFKRLAPRTLFKLDFLEGWARESDLGHSTASLVKADIFLAAVTIAVTIDTLKLDVHDAHLFKSVLVHLEPELMTSTRSLKCFQFRKQGDGHDPHLVTSVLESANGLRELVVTSVSGFPMTTAVLRANDFSRLTTIRISGAIFPGEELANGLSVCRSLLHLRLSDVELSSSEEAWPSVFRTLALMPKLHKLSFFVLRDRSSRHSRLMFCGLKHGKTTHGGKMIEHRGLE